MRWSALLLIAGCNAALAASDAVEAGRSALLARLSEGNPALGRIEVSPLPLQSSRGEPVAYEVPNDLALERRVRLWAIVKDKDGTRRRVASWWSVKAFAPALVAARALRAGEQVRATDLLFEERDLATGPGALLGRDPGVAAARWRATRFIAAGALLRKGDLEPAPEVLAGQPIQVQMVSEALTIETTAIAQSEGRLGERIAVSRPGSAERYYAEVSGERRAFIRGEP